MWNLALALALFSGIARAQEPIRIVEESVVVPDGVDPMAALDSVADVSRIFELYEPAIPWVPGVSLDLEKHVVSDGAPCVLELPVTGTAAGKEISERARVTATTEQTSCGAGTNNGRKITLDFGDSSYNIERRIDRIEITACLARDDKGEDRITATGRMYAGFKPEDPSLNALTEAIGAKAIQGAFIRQVSPIVSAVERHWGDLPQ